MARTRPSHAVSFALTLLALAGCRDPSMARARQLEHDRRWSAAVDAYKEALRRHPYNYRAARRIAAIACYRLQEPALCESWVRRIDRHDAAGRRTAPFRRLRAASLRLRGFEALDAGDPDGAARLARASLGLAPNEPATHLLLGRALAALGRRDEAATCFTRARHLAPGWEPPRRAMQDLLDLAGRSHR